ncbi:hypothetical protein ACFVS2_21535 [Brevibacillus sp. NPDC058079]|uniref:hypothetical protein n=1 Tax=Brevibacillus sp. NPDC058079 TaxID=3346330 RepID=UPI0036E37D3D
MFTKAFEKLKDDTGFISIETIIVAGLMIALGAYGITQFYMGGQNLTEVSIDNVNKVLDIAVTETPIP